MIDYKELYLDRGRLIQKQQKANDSLFSENQRLKKLLEAAVEDLRKLAHKHCTCYACIDNKSGHNNEVCTICQCNGWNNWQWRREEETK